MTREKTPATRHTNPEEWGVQTSTPQPRRMQRNAADGCAASRYPPPNAGCASVHCPPPKAGLFTTLPYLLLLFLWSFPLEVHVLIDCSLQFFLSLHRLFKILSIRFQNFVPGMIDIQFTSAPIATPVYQNVFHAQI